MAESSAIEWTDSTFNPWTGCMKVSPGCDHCYAESWSKRVGDRVGKWGPGAQRVRTTAANWRQPVKWNNTPFYECSACGWRGEFKAARGGILQFFQCPTCGADAHQARRRVFCASLADVFDNEVPAVWRVDLLRLIESTPNLDWLLLTKRIGNVDRMLDEAANLMPEVLVWPPPNVWLGATIVNQEEADRDIPKLLATPAAVRFLSMEPLLGHVSIRGRWTFGTNRVNWVIVGGESGHHARPMHPEWARSLRDQCAAAGVPFLFKQHGEWLPVGREPNEAQRLILQHAGPTARCYSWNDGETLVWAGKKAAGRLLDGRTHDGFPAALAAEGAA